jgi:hypothetical protein
LQLRAASCLPVIAQEIKVGKFGEAGRLLNEAIGEDASEDSSEGRSSEVYEGKELSNLLNYDFETNDSKYRELKKMLAQAPEEKILIFAYYRPTLAYLHRRLMADEITVTVIHGDIQIEERWEEIDRFRDPHGPRVLLSSEVGSEGIDLQFCRVMANYDLPWNPMRVEQRIGRIDRVGQMAKTLSIVNFKVKDTVEERLYDRLHEKLERFANSLGDLEAVIGQEVRDLTIELLSNDLTPDQEKQVIDLTERVIEERLLHLQALEESGDSLIALSDYVQRKIEEDREKGRYIQPEELEDYVIDFFEREFQGCELNQNTPADGCFLIRLNHEAHSSLTEFVHDDRTLTARPFRQREFSITFRREVVQRIPATLRRTVHFTNHLSPLIRWITNINRKREHNFYSISALRVSNPELAIGDYCYRVERWKLKGLSAKEVLAYGIRSLADDKSYLGDDAEKIFQSLLRKGKDWDYVDCDKEVLARIHDELENYLGNQFSIAVEEFEAENITTHQIKVQRVQAFFDRRIAHNEQRLRTLREAGRSPQIIRATEAQQRMAQENRQQRIQELNAKAKTDVEKVDVAAGVFRII